MATAEAIGLNPSRPDLQVRPDLITGLLESPAQDEIDRLTGDWQAAVKIAWTANRVLDPGHLDVKKDSTFTPSGATEAEKDASIQAEVTRRTKEKNDALNPTVIAQDSQFKDLPEGKDKDDKIAAELKRRTELQEAFQKLRAIDAIRNAADKAIQEREKQELEKINAAAQAKTPPDPTKTELDDPDKKAAIRKGIIHQFYDPLKREFHPLQPDGMTPDPTALVIVENSTYAPIYDEVVRLSNLPPENGQPHPQSQQAKRLLQTLQLTSDGKAFYVDTQAQIVNKETERAEQHTLGLTRDTITTLIRNMTGDGTSVFIEENGRITRIRPEVLAKVSRQSSLGRLLMLYATYHNPAALQPEHLENAKHNLVALMYSEITNLNQADLTTLSSNNALTANLQSLRSQGNEHLNEQLEKLESDLLNGWLRTAEKGNIHLPTPDSKTLLRDVYLAYLCEINDNAWEIQNMHRVLKPEIRDIVLDKNNWGGDQNEFQIVSDMANEGFASSFLENQLGFQRNTISSPNGPREIVATALNTISQDGSAPAEFKDPATRGFLEEAAVSQIQGVADIIKKHRNWGGWLQNGALLLIMLSPQLQALLMAGTESEDARGGGGQPG